VTARLLGIAATKAALAKAAAQAEVAAGPATVAGGEVVQREMIVRAPRDTGRLVSLISTDESSLGEGATTKVGSDAPYDRFVQKGTVHMRAQPYGEQAAAASVPGIIAAMTGIFKAAVEG
jgi:Bacteriophage HK97-gp10, putative tail-component